jgi:hypothetical protein
LKTKVFVSPAFTGHSPNSYGQANKGQNQEYQICYKKILKCKTNALVEIELKEKYKTDTHIKRFGKIITFKNVKGVKYGEQ